MQVEKYLPRIVDEQISERMRVFGIVQIEGARYCGKTWTCENHSSSSINLADPSNGFQTKKIAAIDPSFALNGELPRLVDEWQEVPEVRDAAKIIVSESGERAVSCSLAPHHRNLVIALCTAVRGAPHSSA